MSRVKHQAQEEALAGMARGLMRSPTGQVELADLDSDPHDLALPVLTTTTGSITASQTASIASACPTDAATSARVELEPPPPPPPRANQSNPRQPVFFKKQERPRLPKVPARYVGRLSSMEGPTHNITSQPFSRPVKRGGGKALDGWAATERQTIRGLPLGADDNDPIEDVWER